VGCQRYNNTYLRSSRFAGSTWTLLRCHHSPYLLLPRSARLPTRLISLSSPDNYLIYPPNHPSGVSLGPSSIVPYSSCGIHPRPSSLPFPSHLGDISWVIYSHHHMLTNPTLICTLHLPSRNLRYWYHPNPVLMSIGSWWIRSRRDIAR